MLMATNRINDPFVMEELLSREYQFFHYWNIDPDNLKRGGLMPPNQNNHKPKRKILLLQRKHDTLGSNLGKTTEWIHRTQLKMEHVEMMGGCKYEKIDENGNLHISLSKKDKKTGKVLTEKQILEVDNIVICAGQESLFDLETELKRLQEQASDALRSKDSIYVFRIGGAFQAGELDAKRAINMFLRFGYDIDQENVEVMDDEKREKGDEERLTDLFSKFMGR